MGRYVHKISSFTVTEKQSECLGATVVWRPVRRRAGQARPRATAVCIGISIDFDICPWSYGPVSEPLFWLLIPNPHWPCCSKKRKHNYQKKASSRDAIRSITFINYVMKEYTNLSYMSRWAGVLLQRLNGIYMDNTPGTHSDTCHIKTVPVILNGL